MDRRGCCTRCVIRGLSEAGPSTTTVAVHLYLGIFRIAHNRCIDFLPGGAEFGMEAEVWLPWVRIMCCLPMSSCPLSVGRAGAEQLVMSLPPKERACVLLKDVFDYTLEEIAELVSSTVGGVKAARLTTGADPEIGKPARAREDQNLQK